MAVEECCVSDHTWSYMNIKKDCVTNDDAIKSEEREKYH